MAIGEVKCVETISALRKLDDRSVHCVRVLGYYAPGDGGGGDFRWDRTATEAENGGTVIVPEVAPTAGRWKRIVEGPLSVKAFGAIGDGEPHPVGGVFSSLQAAQSTYPHVQSLNDQLDWAAIQAAINVIPKTLLPESTRVSGNKYDQVPLGRAVVLPMGAYRVNVTIQIPSGIQLAGEGARASVLYHDHEGACLHLGVPTSVTEHPLADVVRFVHIHDLAIMGRPVAAFGGLAQESPSGLAVQLSWAVINKLENLLVTRTGGGIYLHNSFGNRLVAVTITEMVDGDCIRLEGDSNSTAMVGCRFGAGILPEKRERPTRGVVVNGSSGGTIHGCFFDASDIGIDISTFAGTVVQGLVVSGCRFETSSINIRAGVGGPGAGVQGLCVSGNQFQTHFYKVLGDPKGQTVDDVTQPVAIEFWNSCVGNFVGGNVFVGDKTVTGAAILLRSTVGSNEYPGSLTFVGNLITGGHWDRLVVADVVHNNCFWTEINSMGGAAPEDVKSFRLSSAGPQPVQWGYIDLPFLTLGHADPPDLPAQYGRLYMREDAGEKQLWVRFGATTIKLAPP